MRICESANHESKASLLLNPNQDFDTAPVVPAAAAVAVAVACRLSASLFYLFVPSCNNRRYRTYVCIIQFSPVSERSGHELLRRRVGLRRDDGGRGGRVQEPGRHLRDQCLKWNNLQKSVPKQFLSDLVIQLVSRLQVDSYLAEYDENTAKLLWKYVRYMPI